MLFGSLAIESMPACGLDLEIKYVVTNISVNFMFINSLHIMRSLCIDLYNFHLFQNKL